MSKNIEFKAYCFDLDRVRQACASLGAHLERDHRQRDTYFAVPHHRLKLRESDKYGSCLIHYRRADVSSIRESTYTKIDLPNATASAVGDALSEDVGILVVVEKYRQSYTLDSALINLDTVEELGSFVEIEIDVQQGGEVRALERACWLKDQLNICEIDIVPVSYSDLVRAYQRAKSWRTRLATISNPGHLFLVDGPSASGKSTVATRLRQANALDLTFARRHCTRKRRINDEDEYIFVSNDEFAKMAHAGNFLEHKNFEFGMSYGLSWDEAVYPMSQGKNVLAIMNWGNARHVRRIFPEAKIILTSAGEETLRRRLIRRGIHNPEQLTERLGNAKRFSGYEQIYDLVLSNEDGRLDAVISEGAEYISTATCLAMRHA
jgi:adenylate cyclase class 2